MAAPMVDRNSFMEVLDTTTISEEEGQPSEPRASIAPFSSFQESLLNGGYVIVECDVPPSLSVGGGGGSASGTMSSVGPRDEEMMEVGEDGCEDASTATAAAASTTAKASVTQYFRFHRVAAPYGSAHYVLQHAEKTAKHCEG